MHAAPELGCKPGVQRLSWGACKLLLMLLAPNELLLLGALIADQ